MSEYNIYCEVSRSVEEINFRFRKKIKLPMFILQMIATGYVLLVLYADFGDFLVDEQRGCEDCVDGRKEWVVYYILLLGDVL